MFKVICDGDLSCSKFLEAVRYQAKDGTLYEIPEYCPTDFASTPRETWGPPLFLIPTGWWCLAVGGHDAAYRNLLLIVQTDGTKHLADLTEFESNDLLLEMMESLKPNPTPLERAQMDAIYAGVTLGGWHAFKEDRA